MDIRHIDIDIALKKWDGEEDGQNLYKLLFSRKFRITADFPINMDDAIFRRFIHDRVDTILGELRTAMEVK